MDSCSSLKENGTNRLTVWKLSHQGAEPLGKEEEVWPYWRRDVTQGGFELSKALMESLPPLPAPGLSDSHHDGHGFYCPLEPWALDLMFCFISVILVTVSHHRNRAVAKIKNGDYIWVNMIKTQTKLWKNTHLYYMHIHIYIVKYILVCVCI